VAYQRLILTHVHAGVLLREAHRLAAETIATNLPADMEENKWKTISTRAKNWHRFMNCFGGIVGAFFFPEDDLSQEFPGGSQWTHKSFGTHITEREMDILIELIHLIFPGIQERFRNTALEALAMDMRDEQSRPGFPTMPWEAGPQGIQHALPFLPNHPIINWKRRENPNDWARAFPLPVENPIEELDLEVENLVGEMVVENMGGNEGQEM